MKISSVSACSFHQFRNLKQRELSMNLVSKSILFLASGILFVGCMDKETSEEGAKKALVPPVAAPVAAAGAGLVGLVSNQKPHTFCAAFSTVGWVANAAQKEKKKECLLKCPVFMGSDPIGLQQSIRAGCIRDCCTGDACALKVVRCAQNGVLEKDLPQGGGYEEVPEPGFVPTY